MELTAGTPVLLYDGDCAFCTTSVRTAESILGTSGWTAIPYQRADLDALGSFTDGAVSAARAEREVLWITPTGKVYGGSDAAGKLLLRSGRLPWTALGALAFLPGTRFLLSELYVWIAANRHRLPGGTPACSIADR
jgi:predicted DCC family thiol-disulfide oxidoreductase YuxK